MNRWTILAAVAAAFAGGMAVDHMAPGAQAQAPVLTQAAQTQAPASAGLQPEIIDLAAMTNDQIGPLVPNVGTLRSRTLVALPSGTIAVQAGNVPRHTHAEADEFQYVIAGTGTFWLGDQQRDVHPGDLIVIPRGTLHAGSVPTNGEFKVIAIKLPPQRAGDTHFVP